MENKSDQKIKNQQMEKNQNSSPKQKITPFLWFNDNLEEAVNLYVSVFNNSKILNMHRLGEKVFTATFQLEGQRFMALNGGPQYSFSPAISLFVDCTTQEEVDELWEKLAADPQQGQCGWLKDKFGMSWQIIPSALGELMGDPDREKSKRVMEAMLKMKKIDIAGLKKAYDHK
jgi:predicted 3-demethylubiquinone-9 3-methyltransferase (glyoxalase superfamily)